MTERIFPGGNEDDEYRGNEMPIEGGGEDRPAGGDLQGVTGPMTLEEAGLLGTLEVPLDRYESAFKHNNSAVDDFVCDAIFGKHMPNDRDENGSELDDYITAAAEALSGAVVELLQPEANLTQIELEAAAHGIISRWLIEADSERAGEYYVSMDGDASFPACDQNKLAEELAVALSLDDNNTARHAAAEISSIYYRDTTAQIKIVWEALARRSEAEEAEELRAELGAVKDALAQQKIESEETRAVLGEIRDELKEINKSRAFSMKIGAHLMDILKITASVSAGIMISRMLGPRR